MIDIRIVCTHDAVKFAEALARLLEADQHLVRLSFGRQSMAALENAKVANEAVLLVWSTNAPAQHYMLEWARAIPPARLVELACAPGWPRFERRAPVIDFTGWRMGDPSGRAWGALTERIDALAATLAPVVRHRANRTMLIGLTGFAAAAVGGVIALQPGGGTVSEVQSMPEPPPLRSAQVDFQEIAVGGAVELIEPDSAEDLLSIPSARTPRLRLSSVDLLENQPYEPPELRRPTLRERIGALNPLRALDDGGESNEG